ncbi:precorrin-6A/cobalt-precorrin-6A reductase [Pseudovibrio denitrificans]|uniref:precorrin-6A/cobalt-precorrin-6A reductase n=1 Tax=Pseudovibrio denitrificans TaxID=258256 RepID=UPI0039BEE060
MMLKKPKVLVLAGTKDARKLVEALVATSKYELIASLAGVTRNPADLMAPTRTGGFGGAERLAEFLRTQNIAAVINATHPYAAQMSQNAVEATTRLSLPLIRFEREPWKQETDDNWQFAETIEAALKLVPPNKKVFFAASSKVAAPLKKRPDLTFIIRTLNIPTQTNALLNANYIEGLPNSDWQTEAKLFQELQIDWLISKNSGGSASYGKIKAARELGLPVAMIKRPKHNGGVKCSSIDEVLNALPMCVGTEQTTSVSS